MSAISPSAGLSAPSVSTAPGTSTVPRGARSILAVGGLLGVTADLALRNAPDGLGWALWVLMLALTALAMAACCGRRLAREPIGWLVVAVGCAAAFAWRDAELLRVANVFGTLVALAMFAMSAAGLPVPSVLVARLRDVLAAGIHTLLDLAGGAPMLVMRDAELAAMPAIRGGAHWSVVRAVLLTVPVALVFVVLLSHADPVFAAMFRLPDIDVDRVVPHVVTAGAFAWWSAGWMRGALLGVTHRAGLPERMPVQLGMAEITTSMGAVIVLFALFVSLQLRWLFGGAEAVLATTGLTVAEYARRGFFELVGVAALVLPLIMGSRAAVVDAGVARRHRQLSLVLIVLLIAIMFSAALRMRLYIGYFGLTTDRFVASALMAWLCLVTLALVRSVWRGWPKPLAATIVLSGFATLFALNIANPDARVAHVNISRLPAVRDVDHAYLARLSGDAVPAVVRALNTATPSQATCLSARALRTRWLPAGKVSWNLGAQRARQAVETQLTAREEQRLCFGIAD